MCVLSKGTADWLLAGVVSDIATQHAFVGSDIIHVFFANVAQDGLMTIQN